MGRSACCEKIGLKKGPWTAEEDQKLRTYIQEHGYGSWRSLPSKAGLERCGKSCRLRWINYLRPDIKRGKFSLQEERTIIQLHALLGNRWSAIASHLSRRTDNEIKNYWNTHLKKRLTKMGIDPITHKPKSDAIGSSHSKNDANISHMAQWENARLEAEARLGQDSKLLCSNPYQLFQLDSITTLTNHQIIINNKTCTPKMPPTLDVLKACQGAWTTTRDIRSLINFNGSLKSPTSTLNVPNTLGFVEDVLANTWNHKMELTETTYYHASYISDTSRLPTITESYTDELVSRNEDDGNNLITNSLIEQHKNVDQIGTCGDEFGENKNYYWDNMVKLVTSQSRSSMF